MVFFLNNSFIQIKTIRKWIFGGEFNSNSSGWHGFSYEHIFRQKQKIQKQNDIFFPGLLGHNDSGPT